MCGTLVTGLMGFHRINELLNITSFTSIINTDLQLYMSLMSILLLNAMASRLSVMGPSKIRTPKNSQEKNTISQLPAGINMEEIYGAINNSLPDTFAP